jgi:hypothetical protein
MSLPDDRFRWTPAIADGPCEAVVLGAPQSLGVARADAVRKAGRASAVVVRLEPGGITPTTGQRIRYTGGPWPLRASLVEVLP